MVSPSSPPSPGFRPLAQVVPRPDGDALVFTVGEKQVRIEADKQLLTDVLGRCNGHTTASDIAAQFSGELRTDVEQLLAALLEHQVVVDCTEAYRLFHRQSSSKSGLFRTLDAEDLEALMQESFTPRSLSNHREPLDPATGSLAELVARRSSARPGAQRQVSFAELSAVLRATCGTASGARPVPSAGALYPLVVHALIREAAPPLDVGLWWYDPARAELRLQRAAPIQVRRLFIPQPVTDDHLVGARPLLFLSANLGRMARKYSNRGYRYALIEVGAAMQNAYLAATELDVPIRAVGGFHDDRAHECLDLPEEVVPLLALLLGA